MNAQEYIDQVEAKDILHKRLENEFPVKDNGSPLVSLKGLGFDLIYEPSIMKDYQYFIREELVEKIGRISQNLTQENKTLVIRSAWRSFKHQRLLWGRTLSLMRRNHPEITDDDLEEIVSYYIAPEEKSTHSTGGAVDALIYDKKTDKILDFGTNKGYKIDLSKECYPLHPGISKVATENRTLLIDLFEKEDFVCDMKEYWHFDYGNIGWAIEKGKKHAFFGILEKG